MITRKFLAILYASFILTACGLGHQDSPETNTYGTIIPNSTSKPNSQARVTHVIPYPQTKALTPALPIASTPSESCISYTNGSSVYLDEIPAFTIRQGPGCEYEAVTQSRLFKSNSLAFYNILGKQGDWLLVDLCNNARGWVFAPAIYDVNIHINPGNLPIFTPPATQVVSPTTAPLGESSEAKRTLISFFDFLHDRNYEKATKLFGGGYGNIIMWNPDLDIQDYPGLLKRACEQSGFQCFLRIRRVVKTEQVSPMEYHFTVEFIKEDGSLYHFRNIQDSNIANSQFLFRVVRDCNGKYFVTDWPFYTG